VPASYRKADDEPKKKGFKIKKVVIIKDGRDNKKPEEKTQANFFDKDQTKARAPRKRVGKLKDLMTAA
jgi:hypothetical protein